jgi:peptidoglycan/LPS O-acetylase OafA/YrhL
MNTSRYHSLDALRAFALLLGVVLHAGLSHLLPPGVWAVGTAAPSKVVGWFVLFTHSFRMELFFMLAGFFAAMAVQKRGVRAFLASRLRRIALVFILLLYPMKLTLAALWIAGGRRTGWLALPPEAAALPWWKLALGSALQERFPHIQLTHLWFLYYLMLVTALFLLGRFACGFIVRKVQPALTARTRAFASHALAPLALALAFTPVLAAMTLPGIDTPDLTLAPHGPVLILYGAFFCFGWWLHGSPELLRAFARRWPWQLAIAFVASLPAAALTGMLYSPEVASGPHYRELKWASSFLIAVVMMFSVPGLTGLFSRCATEPSRWIRGLASASYFVYLAHLPLVVALQVLMAGWRMPWWIEVPANSLATLLALLAVYKAAAWLRSWNVVPAASSNPALPGTMA